MTTPTIPQTDPRAGYLEQRAGIDAAVSRVLEGGWYILGNEVRNFEAEFAAYTGVRHGVGVANGTDALVLALKAAGVGRGDVVATVSHTAVATVAAIEIAGATPLLLDIDPATYTMDPAELERAFGMPEHRGRIKAVIPVHLYGQAADLDRILPLARAHGAKLIEDCAQCHGATLNERRLGTFGDVACFSLYPTKNLGAFGDGGCVVTNDDGIAESLRTLREYGWRARYVSDVPGVNSRLDELHAAMLRVKLAVLDADNSRRRAIADRYDSGLAGFGRLGLPARRPGAEHVFHQYVVRSPRRDSLRAALQERGVGTNIHYPVPIHEQPAYRGRVPLGPSGLAATEQAAREVLSLPMYPQLSADQAERVVRAVAESV